MSRLPVGNGNTVTSTRIQNVCNCEIWFNLRVVGHCVTFEDVTGAAEMFEPPQYVFVSIFLYPLCRCLYIFVSLYDTYYIEHVSVRNNKNQASQVFVLTYLDGFAVCLWKLVSPTWSAKILATEIFTKLWRTQRRRYNAGGQNLWGVRRIRGLSWELCCKVVFGTFFFKGCLRKFWNRNFRETWAPRGV